MPDAQSKRYVMEVSLHDGTTHQIPFEVPAGEDGGFYTPAIRKISDTEIEISFTPSKEGMPGVAATSITIGGGSADLTGYATEQWVKDQKYLTEVPEGYATEQWVKDQKYLTEVPEGYAKTENIPTKPEDIGAQPSGNYLTEVPSGYATEEFVKNKIAEAELSGEEVDLSGYAMKSELPTKTSQLTNDSGYLTDVPDGYAKSEDIPKNPGDIGAQPEGDYALRSEIPSVPTQVSAFTNDAGYLTQHQDISGKLDTVKLPEAINEALAQAKTSGEFDGKDGYTPQKGVDYVDGEDGVSATHSWNGTVLTITSASGTSSANLKGDKGDSVKGDPGYTPVRGTDYWTDEDIAEIKSYVDEAILGGAW